MKVTINEKAKTMTIELPLQEPKPSASGKNMLIATTSGNQKTDSTYKGNQVTVSVNAYFKP